MEERQNILIPNSTQIPNIISDLIEPRISEGEMRCLNYICRRTYGFQKERDRISLSQFVDGIVSKDKKRLDYGTGLSRPSVVEALRNLLGANLIKVIPTSGGNYYEINLELFKNKTNKEVEELSDEVVKKVNQLRKLTRSGKESKPKQVNLLNLQNKEKQRETKNMSDKPTGFNLKEEIEKLKADKRRHIQIVGLWIEINPESKPENKEQFDSIKNRNLRPAALLKGYSDEDIRETFKYTKTLEYLTKIGLETILKYIDGIVARKQKIGTGKKIIGWEEVKYPNGEIRMKPIFEVKK